MFQCSGFRGDIGTWKEDIAAEFKAIKDKYHRLEYELSSNDKRLKLSKDKYHSLEKEFNELKTQKDSLYFLVSKSTEELSSVIDQKEKVMKELISETQRRRELENQIKQFTGAFTSRQQFLKSFQLELKTKLENLKAQNPVHPIPNSLRY